MIALITYEFIEWQKRFAKITLIILTVLCFIVSFLSFIRPEIFFQVLTVTLLFISFIIYYLRDKYIKTALWIRELKLNLFKIIFVQVLSSVFFSILYLLFLLPLYVLNHYLWGILFEDIIKVIIVILFVFITTSNITRITYEFDKENQLLFGVYILFTFYILPLFIPFIKNINPFYQIGKIFSLNKNNFNIYIILNCIFNFMILYIEYLRLKKLKNIYE